MVIVMTEERLNVVDRARWLEARTSLLVREKAFARERDALSAARRVLPWVTISDYVFEETQGPVALSELFNGSSQLVVYHFMFAPDDEEGCPLCSFWADNFERSRVHLAARDVSLAAVSRADAATLDAFKMRMGWTFPWVSSGKTTFNSDFGVSFTEAEIASLSAPYNYQQPSWLTADLPGVSVFAKGADGQLYHTYSTYARGLEDLNTTYRYLDIVPKGRNETDDFSMAWVRYHDRY